MNEFDLFISFLKKNRIYKKFMRNVDVTNWKDKKPLIASFKWSATEEGSMFWSKIYAKWRIYRDEHDNI